MLDIIELTRPLNVLITAAVVVVGGLMVAPDSLHPTRVMLVAALSAGLVAAGANALNDYYDVAVDLVNRPTRPIPSGRVGITTTFILGWFLTLFGVGLGWGMGKSFASIAAGVALLLWFYNRRLKNTPLWGNLAVALCGGLAFIYGGMAAGNPVAALIPAGFAFLIHLGREIVKDVEDQQGDRLGHARTLPIVIGEQRAMKVAAAVLLVLAVGAVIPYFTNGYPVRYIYLMTIFVSLPLFLLAIQMMFNILLISPKIISNTLKILMLNGLIILYVQ
jgi:geranylgeranylglycerol-phosphate geranylgeranyltransferase